MKKFTRVLALLLTFIMLTAVGCGSNNEKGKATDKKAEKKTHLQSHRVQIRYLWIHMGQQIHLRFALQIVCLKLL